MRIAFFTEGFDPYINGVVVLIKAYQQALEAMGHEVVVFVPENPTRPANEQDVVRLPSIRWHKEAYRTLRPFSGTEHKFSQYRFDVVHSHHPWTTGLAAEKLAQKFNLPLVFTFHTLLPSYSVYAPVPRSWAESTLEWVLKRHCSRADAITVTTEIMAKWLRDRGVTRPICLARPPVLIAEPHTAARPQIRNKLGIPDDVSLLLFAGRLVPEKDLDFLVRAVARIKSRADFRLVFIGGGPSERMLRCEVEKLGLQDRTKFLGFVKPEEMADYHAAADIFCFPSRSDTLGMVVVEAMASGVPVVAINENGPSELVLDNKTGFLTPFDEATFSNRILDLIRNSDKRKKFGQNGVAWSRQFCAEDAAKQLVRAYGIAADNMDRRPKSHRKRPIVRRKVRNGLRKPL